MPTILTIMKSLFWPSVNEGIFLGGFLGVILGDLRPSEQGVSGGTSGAL